MTWTQRERDNAELGTLAAGHLLAEQAPDDTARQRHLRLVGGVAVSLAWVRWYEAVRS